MRISTSYMQQQSLNTMLTQQAQLADTQLQVSTGQRIISPSDDPVGAVKSLNYERDIAVIQQYLNNSDVAENKISASETALSSAADIIQRIRELSVQALNDTNDATSRTGIAAEIDELNQSLLGLANTTDSNGEYLFSGYQSFTEAFDTTTFAYGGDSGQRTIKVSSQYSVEATEPGSDIFVITNVDSSTQSIFQTIDEFSTALKANSMTTPNDGDFLDNIDTALESVSSARTRLGARINAITQQRTINEDSTTILQTSLSKINDLDYAEAISTLNAQTTGLQAAQAAYVKVQGLSLFNYL